MDRKKFPFEMPEDFEISEAEQELSERIEKLPAHDGDKMQLLLAWKGLKKATEIEIHSAGGEDDFTESDIQNAVALFKDLNLNSHFETPAEDSTDEGSLVPPVRRKGWGSFYVGENEDDIAKVQTWKHTHTIETTREAGLVFGFPPTAVEAFCKIAEERSGPDARKKYSIEHKELPDDVREEDYMAFAQFRLSREHWREELETAKAWASTVKRFDPRLYDRIVATHRYLVAVDDIRRMIGREAYTINKEGADDETTLASLNEVLYSAAEWVAREDFKKTIDPEAYEHILRNMGDYKKILSTLEAEYKGKTIPPEIRLDAVRKLWLII